MSTDSSPPFLTLADFESLVDRPFSLARPDGPLVPLVLASTKRLSPATQVPGGRVPFALVFLAEPSARLAQGTYEVRFPDGTRTASIFLVPVGQRDGRLELEAIYT